VCSAQAVQTAGTIIQGGAQIQAGRQEQAAAEHAARMATAQAEASMRRGRFEEMRYRRQVERAIGAQRAAGAASGLDVGTGTLADIQVGTERVGELDALQIRRNAFMEASGYAQQAQQFKRAARGAKYAGFATGAGTLLTGAGTIYASKEREPPTLFGTGKKKPAYGST
jgi:hypothetical protein